MNGPHQVMNAPREYYPVNYEKDFDDNFTSKVELPDTGFECGEQKHFPGLYGDEDLGCMVFHVCAFTDDGLVMKSFLCPESTLFDQTILKCNWWFYVDCKSSKKLYDISAGQAFVNDYFIKCRPRIQVSAKDSSVGQGLKCRSRAQVSAKDSSVGQGFKCRPRIQVSVKDSSVGQGLKCRSRIQVSAKDISLTLVVTKVCCKRNQPSGSLIGSLVAVAWL
ncbi:hypothetical protein WDU94_004506 [Cyamophila willieti]